MLVLIQQGEGEGVLPGGGNGENGHLLPGVQGGVELGGGLTVHRYQLAGQQGFNVVAAFAFDGGQQEGEQSGLHLHSVAGLFAFVPEIGLAFHSVTALSYKFNLSYHKAEGQARWAGKNHILPRGDICE